MVHDLNSSYEFDDIDITLGDHHKLTRGSVKVNIKECMEFVTSNADWDAILNDRFVKKHYKYIEMLANADEAVCLFDLKIDGEYFVCILFYQWTYTNSILSYSIFHRIN